MSKSTLLAAPPARVDLAGRFAVAQFYRSLASVAAPISPIVLNSVQGVDMGAPSFMRTKKTNRYGSGDRFRQTNREIEGTVTLGVMAGEVPYDIANILGQTWSGAGIVAVQHIMPTYPLGCLELIYRAEDEATVLFQQIIPECIVLPWAMGSDLENANASLPMKNSGFEPLTVYTGHHLVVDKFTANGSTTSFNLSSDPIDLVDATQDHNAHYAVDNAIYVKFKPTADEAGYILKSGFSINSGTPYTLDFTTAPAAGTIEIAYIGADA